MIWFSKYDIEPNEPEEKYAARLWRMKHILEVGGERFGVSKEAFALMMKYPQEKK